MHPALLSCLLLLIALAAPARALDAAGAVQRCEDRSGQIVYSDRPCVALGARPLPLPASLQMRIAAAGTERRVPARQDATENVASAPSAPMSVRPAHRGCARSTGQLASDVRHAIASRNVNRLAESYHWVDQSSTSALDLMQQLERMTATALLDAQIFDAQIFSASSPIRLGGERTGLMQLHLGGQTSARVVNLHVVRYAGCYFARF